MLTVTDRNDPQKLAERLDQLTASSTAKKEPCSSNFSTVSSAKKTEKNVESQAAFMQSKTKRLDDIMKTELLADKNSEEITQVTILYGTYNQLASIAFVWDFRFGTSILRTKSLCLEFFPNQSLISFMQEQCNFLQ